MQRHVRAGRGDSRDRREERNPGRRSHAHEQPSAGTSSAWFPTLSCWTRPGADVQAISTLIIVAQATTRASLRADRPDDLLGVNEWHGGRYRSLVQVAGLCWSYEVGAGR
jgi:hypothetical protein